MYIRTEKITLLDLHHTAGNEADAAEIRRSHLSRGFGDIGYNWIIRADGTVEKGRDPYWAGAHDPGIAPGQTHNMNQVSLSISHIGNFMLHDMPEAQFQSSLNVAERECRTRGILPTKAKVRRHKDQYATNCPGDRFPYDRYIYELKKRLEGGTKSVKRVVVIFSSEDQSAGNGISNLLGGVAIFNRNGATSIHADAQAADKVFNVGGPPISHPNVLHMSGDTAMDTLAEVIKKYKAGEIK